MVEVPETEILGVCTVCRLHRLAPFGFLATFLRFFALPFSFLFFTHILDQRKLLLMSMELTLDDN